MFNFLQTMLSSTSAGTGLDGFSPEQIQRYTGLSPEDIEAL
jgi:hypothetical protein